MVLDFVIGIFMVVECYLSRNIEERLKVIFSYAYCMLLIGLAES